MKEEKDRRPLKEKLQEAVKESTGKKDSQELNPYVKAVLIAGSIVLLAWGSGFVFKAFAGAIRGFKDLKKSIKE